MKTIPLWANDKWKSALIKFKNLFEQTGTIAGPDQNECSIFAVFPLEISYIDLKVPLKLFNIYSATLKMIRNIYIEFSIHKITFIKIP